MQHPSEEFSPIAFFTQLGYAFNPQFTDEHATCMIIGDNIFAMLLVEKYFATFTSTATRTSTATCGKCSTWI